MQQVNIQELNKSRQWPRTTLDMHKLGELVWSILNGGFRDEASVAIVYEVIDGVKEIKFGHRRTLAYALATQWQDATGLDEIVEHLYATSVTSRTVTVCPMCGERVDEEVEVCPGCNADLVDTDGAFLGVPGTVDEFDPTYFITHYNEVIHAVDGTVPSVETEYKGELDSLLSLIGDNAGREDDDTKGLVLAVGKAVKAGATKQQIAALGISQKSMANYVALAAAPEEIVNLATKGELPISVAYIVSSLRNAQERAAVYNYIMQHSISTQAGISSLVKNLSSYTAPAHKIGESPLQSNYVNLYAEAMMRVPFETWIQHVMEKGFIPREVIINSAMGGDYANAHLSCAECPLRGHMADLPRVEGKLTYPCQASAAHISGCLLHASQVIADYRVQALADLSFDDGTYWFSTLELAQRAYGALTVTLDEESVVTNERPIDAQRQRIAAWMQAAPGTNGATHPVATLCAHCQYHTEESPVRSDPTAPHCAWAASRSRVEMGYLVETTGGPYRIPLCRQYAPSGKRDIPETAAGHIPEELVDALITELAGQLTDKRIAPMTFLVGRPFGNEAHQDWFMNKFRTNAYTQGEKVTLMLWLLFEIGLQRHAGKLQLPAGRVAEFDFEVSSWMPGAGSSWLLSLL